MAVPNQNHATYVLKGLGIRFCFPGQTRSPFRVKNVFADNGFRSNIGRGLVAVLESSTTIGDLAFLEIGRSQGPAFQSQ